MSALETKELLYSVEDGIATITVNRPDKLNALNTEVVNGLHALIDAIDGDRSIRVVVLRGTGDKSFVAGADIGEFAEMEDSFAFRSYFDSNIKLCAKISNLSQPVICAVDGYALGGGCALTLASDFVIATDRSSFGVLESNMGFVGNGSSLTRLCGRHKAAELTMLGLVIDAQEAYRLFLVNRVVSPEQLDEEVDKLCRKLIRRSYFMLKMTKQTIRTALDTGLSHANDFETDAAVTCFDTKECQAAIEKFLNKNK